MTKKKWLSFRGADPTLKVIEEKDDEWGSVTKKSSELIKGESGDYHKIKITYSMLGIWEQIRGKIDNDQEFAQIEIPSGGQMLESPGSPQMPQEGLFVAIPDDAKDIEIEVEDSESKEYDMDKEIMPTQEPTKDATLKLEKDEIYEKDEFYPGVLFKNLGPRKIGEVNTLQIMIYPVQYNPQANKIQVYSKIELEIKYKTPKSTFRGGYRSPPPSRKRRVPKMYKESILNLDNI